MRALRWIRGVVSATALLAVSQRAGAEQDFEFRARRLELDPSLRRLRLSGDVRVWVDRYRLTSEELEVSRESTEIRVVGPADVAFCPCPHPPLTLHFTEARFAAPGDVFVTNPTVRVAGAPILWLPYLWLRSPRSVGVLPLKIAYRGEDGLLLGSGLHVPAGDGWVELGGAGYLRGGAEVEARIVTPRTSTLLRWDHLRDSSLAVDLRGALSPSPSTSIAWSADALRGARSLRGPALLEEVALRQDRAAAAAGWSRDGAIAGVGVSVAGRRGDGVTAFGAAGPELHAGFGGAFGNAATGNVGFGVTTWARPELPALTLLSQRGELRGDARAGPLALSIEGRTRAVATLGDREQGFSAATALVAEASAPFVRDFGAADRPLVHWVTPFVGGMVGGADTRAPSVASSVAADGAFFTFAGGVRSTLGETAGDRGGASISVRGGLAGERGAPALPVVVYRATGRALLFALRGEGMTIRGAESGDVVLGAVRFGAEDGLFVEGRTEGLRGSPPLLGRLLLGGFDAPWVPWLAEPGWSVGGRVGVSWTRFLSTTADADHDVTTGVLLGVRGAAIYRHPCGCISVTAWAGHRVARPGADAFVTMSLFP